MNSELEYDSENVRRRYILAVESLYGKSPSRKFKNKTAYCKSAGHELAALNAVESGRNKVSMPLLFGLHKASDGEVDIREVLAGKGMVGSAEFTIPPGYKLVSIDKINQLESMIEFQSRTIKLMKSE